MVGPTRPPTGLFIQSMMSTDTITVAATSTAVPAEASRPTDDGRVVRVTEPPGPPCRGPEVAALTQMVDLLESVHRCRDSFHARLELKCQVQGIVSRLVQVPAM